MSGQRYTPEFKGEVVKQIIDRGYSNAEVSERLGVSQHSLYKWVNAVKPGKSELRRAEEERDILKRPLDTLQASPSEVSVHQ